MTRVISDTQEVMIYSRDMWELIARAPSDVAETAVHHIADRSGQLKGVAIACLVSAIVGVLLRFYVRAFIIKRVAIDDWLMLLSMVSI